MNKDRSKKQHDVYSKPPVPGFRIGSIVNFVEQNNSGDPPYHLSVEQVSSILFSNSHHASLPLQGYWVHHEGTIPMPTRGKSWIDARIIYLLMLQISWYFECPTASFPCSIPMHFLAHSPISPILFQLVQGSNVLPGSFSAENCSRRSPCSEIRFLPRKACEFQPAELVTACHRFVTARFLGEKVRKTGPQFPSSFSAGFSRPGSPPRTWLGARQPAEVLHVTRQPAELVTANVTGV